MSRWIRGAAVLVGLAAGLAPASAGAQARSKLAQLSKSLEVAVFTANESNPLVRQPGPNGGGQELPVRQTSRSTSVRVGAMFAAERAGIELAGTWWRTALEDFTFSGGATGGSRVSYSDVGLTYLFGDAALHYAPWPKVPASAYGLVGLGWKSRSYDITGAPFPEWNGHQGATEFVYSYGLGVRLFPERHVSLAADFRWIPGDLITEGGDCWHYYSNGSSWSSCSGHPANRTHVLSLGVLLAMPMGSAKR